METESSPSTEVCKTQPQNSKYSRFLLCKELLQIVERDLEKPNSDELSVTDFMHLEKQFEAALGQTRATKTRLLLESISTLHEKEKMLEEERMVLQEKIGGSKKKTVIDLNAAPQQSENGD